MDPPPKIWKGINSCQLMGWDISEKFRNGLGVFLTLIMTDEKQLHIL